ncbi:alpha-ketoacid dehydrogenase subunit beta [Sporichthya sp.]|uniref:alpha-ketoacid dehydrogenase subunit beta n=1 Tax=Sporichthya sp. TaxID=65475 RepID=UPI0017EAD38C|nr:alpha-ketoacid dehydrogenase subunit beta [Sporichthya sp.]MBA3743127.1 alpha-ketoacid dehydrogenase subunit beta [Sporichthya sp.]
MSTIDAPGGTRLMGFGEALNDALDVALQIDPTVVLLGEDIDDESTGGNFKITAGLSTKHGDHRVRTTPISEQAIVGAAIGGALGGLRPVAEIMFVDFLAVAMDQIVNHAARLRYMSGGKTPVPITIRTASAGGQGFGGQHSGMLESWFTHVPGLKVVVPASADDAKGLLLSSIFDPDPVLFIESSRLYFGNMAFGEPGGDPRRLHVEVPLGDYRVPLGKARIRREGDAVTLVTYGRQVDDATKVADRLAEEGISVELIDLRSLVPLDLETVLASAAKTRRVVIFQEAVTRSGFGGELAARITEELFDTLEVPVRRLGAPNTPVPYAANLETAYQPSAEALAAEVRETVERKARAS